MLTKLKTEALWFLIDLLKERNSFHKAFPVQGFKDGVFRSSTPSLKRQLNTNI